MDLKTKRIIKIAALVLLIVVVAILWFVLFNFNEAKIEDFKTPFDINITIPTREQPIINNQNPQIEEEQVEKPFTRDENDMPKSDLKVPEIG